MTATTVIVNDQQKPAQWLNRKFSAAFNLPFIAKRTDNAKSFPASDRDGALALVALFAARLRFAQLGAAQANDANIAGSVAAWAAEVTDAQTQLDIALTGVVSAFPSFRTGQNCYNRVFAVAANKTAGTVKPPASLGAAWAAGTSN